MLNYFKKYIEEILTIHARIFYVPINIAINSSNKKIAVIAANIKFRLKGFALKINYEEELDIFSITDGKDKHYFGNLLRGLDHYRSGLSYRANKLFSTYLLENIRFELDDIVIDCGANYGDLWLSLKDKIRPSSYITFEPGILENRSIKNNAPLGIHNRLGLSNKRDIATTFYVNEEGGDSSIVEPLKYSKTINIETTTLSEYVIENNINHIKLLKLEAEGFEPEILEGSLDILNKISYICIDGGYERGVNEDETFTELTNKLLKNGFEMVSVNLGWGRALFKNINL